MSEEDKNLHVGSDFFQSPKLERQEGVDEIVRNEELCFDYGEAGQATAQLFNGCRWM